MIKYSEKFLEKLQFQSNENKRKSKILSHRRSIYESIENGEPMYNYSYDMEYPNINKRSECEW